MVDGKFEDLIGGLEDTIKMNSQLSGTVFWEKFGNQLEHSHGGSYLRVIKVEEPKLKCLEDEESPIAAELLTELEVQTLVAMLMTSLQRRATKLLVTCGITIAASNDEHYSKNVGEDLRVGDTAVRFG
ncbi:Hypothetical predicted protein [Olea europaea subsp. europaea]|uniref:Uncharacterized protein n=1 Tax=Olea europaea subsp. europaea TaxID=158383 RepID=A0A8S0UZM2_OLEEU|nr:Hypothetical predicted protein [Olea europaea subsp. europaea]